MCRGHAQATSTFVSPLHPGFYTLRLVRNETETLAMATFRVHKPLSENGKGQHWSGEWLDDPEKFEEPQDSWEPNVVQALRTGLQKQRSMNNANSSPIDSVADDGSMPHF